ncbi:MAG: NACHT domain-containing protein [bacterium]|nr:NACHT domain-containing protein [bacterium]
MPDHAPKPNAGLTDLFVPVSFIEEHGKEAWSLAELQADLFARGTDRTAARVVVLGDPGSGKSTLCRYQTVAAAGRDESPAPLLIPLREYLRQGRRDGLLAFAADEATQRLAVPVDESDLIALCKAGRALLLVDGLDEVVDPGDRERVRDMVQGVAHTYPGLAVMVTSRIVGYDQAPLNRKHFHHLRLAPFDDAQLDQFVTAWYEVAEPRDPVERSRRRGELLNALAAEPRARELARNPLFATLIALVHRYEATLPGQRAQLYELCVRMLLETWPSARGQRFPDLDEGRQRQVLERLALRMQEERGRRTKSDVTIGRSDLEQALIELLQEREFSDVPEGETRRLVTRWIDYLAARTGLLVEQQPTVFGFLHLSLMEYLAGRALFAREQAGGDDRLARFIADHHDQAQWRETLLLLLGSEATRGGLIDAVFDHLMKHPRWSGFTFLMELLREEVMLRPGQRDSVLSGAAELALDRRSYEWFVPRHTLGQVLDFSQRHADGVSTWFRDRLTSTTGRDLQGSLALIPQEGERAPPGPLAARTDLDSMLPALLELWPGNTWGTWAMEQANHETALAWLIQEPLDLIVWTALNCLRLHWSVGAAAHAAILGRRAGWVAAQILQAAESNSPRGRPGSVNDRQAKLRCSESAIVVDLRPATSVLPWDREEIVPKSLPWSRHSHIVDNITETKTKPWEQLHGATYLRAYLRRDSKGVKLATYSPIVHLNIEQDREKQNAGDDVLRPYKAMFALEASAALLDVQPSSERYVSELPLILSAIRIQNRWFHHFFKRFYIFGVANSPEHHALTLALALAQYQTTWQWPDCEGWQRFYTEEPPDHWLPAHFWHLCKAVDERDDPSHLQRAEKALERGEPPELVAALRRWMVRPTPTEKLALFRDPESRPT